MFDRVLNTSLRTVLKNIFSKKLEKFQVTFEGDFLGWVPESKPDCYIQKMWAFLWKKTAHYYKSWVIEHPQRVESEDVKSDVLSCHVFNSLFQVLSFI